MTSRPGAVVWTKLAAVWISCGPHQSANWASTAHAKTTLANKNDHNRDRGRRSCGDGECSFTFSNGCRSSATNADADRGPAAACRPKDLAHIRVSDVAAIVWYFLKGLLIVIGR